MTSAPIAKFNREALSPERLSAITSTAEGRQLLQRLQLSLKKDRDEMAESLRAQIAESDELLARIDTALNGGLLA